MTWDKIWAVNKKFIDPTSTRYFSISCKQCAKIHITNLDDTVEVRQRWKINQKVIHTFPFNHKFNRIKPREKEIISFITIL